MLAKEKEQVIWLTVILLSPFNVDVGSIFSRKIKDVPDDRLRLWPRWVGSASFSRGCVCPEQEGDEHHD